MEQLHKRFTDTQVKEFIERYLKKEIERSYIQEILNIGKSRFFELTNEYRKNPDKFLIEYEKTIKKISQDTKKSIIK